MGNPGPARRFYRVMFYDEGSGENVSSQALLEELGVRLRALYPHGHSAFIANALKDVALHSTKNRDYAHGGPALGNFQRVASLMATYPDLKWGTPEGVCLAYLFKQLDALLWHLNTGHALAESPLERVGDIIVYASILRCMIEDRA